MTSVRKTYDERLPAGFPVPHALHRHLQVPGACSLAEVQVEPALAKLLPDARGRWG